MSGFLIRFTKSPAFLHSRDYGGSGFVCRKKPSQVPSRTGRSVSQAAQGLLSASEASFRRIGSLR